MEKQIKHYVQKVYIRIVVNVSVEEEITERNPKLVKNDGEIQCFRFFDKDINGEKQNYSNWVYFGKRLSLKEVKEKYSKYDYGYLIWSMEQKKYEFACRTQTGKLFPLNDTDIIYDEYFSNKDNQISNECIGDSNSQSYIKRK